MIDSHCHIDMPQFDADRAEVVARAREAGVEDMLLIGGVDEEQGHRRALRVAGRAGLSCLRRHPSPRGAAGHARPSTTSSAGLARGQAHRRHRRDRPRLPLRPLAARRAARGRSAPRCAWPGRLGCPSSSTPARPTRRRRPCWRRRGRERGASSIASPAGTTWRGAPWPSASTSPSPASSPSRGRR